MSSLNCVRVPPRSRAALRQTAGQLLEFCNVREPPVPIVNILEHDLTGIGLVYEYASRSSMGDDHGRSYPDEGRIVIREDVYERACAGEGRDRLTIAHEIGHVVLHSGLPLSRSVTPSGPVRAYESSEWQANAFAGELLMPIDWVRALCQGPPDLAEVFCVSSSAAFTQWNALCREGVLGRKNGPRC